MSRLPIRVRVSAAFALAMAVVLAASGLFLYLRLGSHLSVALDRELGVRTQDLAALVSQPNASLSGTSGSRFVERGESYAQLVAPDGRVVDATLPLGGASLLTGPELGAALRAPVSVERPAVPGLDEPSRILATRVTRAGRPLVLVVGATTQDRAETLSSFRTELLIAGPIALILATGVGYLLAGLSLAQVESMRRRASGISAETPGERLPVPPTGDELEKLGETLNEMLDRLESALERERDFVADAGHELRTPLALLRTELELALRHAGTVPELKEAVGRASQEADRLAQLAADLLLIASADRGRLPLRVETLDVDALFATVVSRVEWRAEAERKSVGADPVAGLRVRGDSLRLEQALGNLVDNALRYGGDEIRLVATRNGGETELHVRDNGEGFPADYLGRAFERFSTADAARARGGAGLGLSISATIARAHGGSAHIANTAPAGTDVWLSLPDGAPAGRGRVQGTDVDSTAGLCNHRASPIERARGFPRNDLKGAHMSQGTEGAYGRAMPGAGWIGFAGIMLILVGFFNVIDGIAAISDSKYVVNQLLFANLDAWGWFFLIWGVLQILAGVAVLGGAAWAAVVGVVTAFFNAIAQLSWIAVNPWWATIAIVLDVLVIYGLLVYGGRGSEA